MQMLVKQEKNMFSRFLQQLFWLLMITVINVKVINFCFSLSKHYRIWLLFGLKHFWVLTLFLKISDLKQTIVYMKKFDSVQYLSFLDKSRWFFDFSSWILLSFRFNVQFEFLKQALGTDLLQKLISKSPICPSLLLRINLIVVQEFKINLLTWYQELLFHIQSKSQTLLMFFI